MSKTNLFIISHKLDVLDDKFPAKITVEKIKLEITIENIKVSMNLIDIGTYVM